MAQRRRSAEREAWWRKQVRRQRASGLSVRRFCEAEGLSEPSFYAWRRTLEARSAAAQTPEFVPLRIASPVASSRAGITIELRGGRLVHLPPSMPAEQVVALLHRLEAAEATP